MAKVLLVDDNKDLHKSVGVLLEKICKHKIISAYDGNQGLDKLFENLDTQIILVDYNMPIMNGYHFSEELRTNPEYEKFKDIPIIGIGEFPETRREYLTEFKPKPFDFLEINKLIKKYSK